MSDTAELDRNLLFGVLACELKYLNQPELLAAAKYIVQDNPFGKLLLERELLNQDEFQFIDSLVDYYLSKNGDAAQSMHAIQPDPSLCEKVLQAIEGGAGDTNTPFAALIAARAVGQYADSEQTVGQPTTVNRFRILHPHAKGGLGEVLLAHDSELNRQVALKRIQSWHADRTDSRSRFILEAEVTGALEHPGIVPIYGLGDDENGRPFYTMRFIEGKSLKNAIDDFYKTHAKSSRSQRAIAFRKILRSFIDACNTIAFAHSRGVLHRDLKPSNIMMGKFGETHVVDWGLAKVLDNPETASTSEPSLNVSSGSSMAQTVIGSTIGTPAYMSPEQAAGNHDALSFASDNYSLGATLYTILTGKLPFVKEADVLEKVQRGEFQPPGRVRSDAPRPLVSICLKAMSRSAEDRYSSAKEVAEEIERWLADESVEAHADSWRERLNRLFRRNKTAVLVATGLLIASTCGLLISNNATKSAYRALTIEAQRSKELAEKNLITAYNAVGGRIRFTEQTRVTDAAIDVFRDYLDFDETDIDDRLNLAKALRLRATQHRVADEEAKSIETYEESLRLMDTAFKDSPSDNLLFSIAKTRNELVGVLQQRQLPRAKEELLLCLDTLRKLETKSPANKAYRMTRARCLENQCNIHLELTEWDAAAQSARKAKLLLKEIFENDHDNQSLSLYFRLAEKEARSHQFNQQPTKAMAVLAEPLEMRANYVENSKTGAEVDHCATLVLYRAASLGLAASPIEETSHAKLDASIREWEQLANAYREIAYYKRYWAQALILRSDHYIKTDPQVARTDLESAEVILKNLLSGGIKAVSYQTAWVDCLIAKEKFALANHEAKQAGSFREEARSMQQRITQKLPEYRRQQQRLKAILENSRLPPVF